MKKTLLLLIFFQFLLFPCFGGVVINEIMYNPSRCPDTYCEYIELYNPTNETLNLSGWNISDRKSGNLSKEYIRTIKFINQTNISPYGYFILARSPENFSQHRNVSCPIAKFTNSLNNGPEIITLYDKFGNLIDSVTYNECWGANGDGNSLQRKAPLGKSNNSTNWISFPPSPGKRNFYNKTYFEIFNISFPKQIFVNNSVKFEVIILNRGLKEGIKNISLVVKNLTNQTIYSNKTEIEINATNQKKVEFNLIFNETGNYTIFVCLGNETIYKNISIIEPPPALNLSVCVDEDPDLNISILGAAYTKLFKVVNNQYKAGKKWNINLSVNYWIYKNKTTILNSSFEIIGLNKQKTANTGRWIPNQTGKYTICGRIINATTTYNNRVVCKNVTVIDPKTIPCNLTIYIYSQTLWKNGEKSKYYIFVNDSSGNYLNYPIEITYWIEDFFGNTLPRHEPYTTIYKIKDNKTLSYTPKLDCGTEAYLIRANITKPYCKDTNPKDNFAQKIIVLIGDKECAPCPSCPKCSSSERDAPSNTKNPIEIKILNLTKTLKRNEEFTTKIRVKNKEDKKISFEIYSYVYKGRKCITGSWIENKKKIFLRKGEEKIINLTNKIKREANPGEYFFKVRVKVGNKMIDVSEKIEVTKGIVIENIKRNKTKIKLEEEKPELKIWNDTKLRINLSHCSNCKMIIVGPNTSVITGRKYRVFHKYGRYDVFVIKEGIVLNKTYFWKKKNLSKIFNRESNYKKITGEFSKSRGLVERILSFLQNLSTSIIKLMEDSIQS